MDQKYIDLFDRYTHGAMKRRDFLQRLTRLAGSAAAATALLPTLENNYALADIVAESDPRIAPEVIKFSAGMADATGYLVKPKDAAKAPAVIVIHENRGLNPHIKDVARRLAAEGFLVLAPDYLSLQGGTPADQDQVGKLKPDEILAISRASVAVLATHANGNGKVGAVGFCWGGGQVNQLAVSEPTLGAGVAYYGRQPKAEDVPAIRAPLLLHYAGIDENTNAGIPAFEKALKDAGKTYELYMYEGANHAFNNDTNAARYNKAAADLAWGRTIEFLRKNLASAA
ncbi:dienelactone hydrolase family protein [soil metagenome]